MNIVILTGSIALWGIVHSLLASLESKSFVRGALGSMVGRAYRFVYNVFSVVTFVPILWLMRILPDQSLYAIPMPWSLLMLAGQGLAVLCLVIAVLQTDTLSFVGIRQLYEEEKPSKLVTRGFYRLVRHPLYLFSLIFLWLTPVLTVNMLIVYVSATVYIFIGAYFEERKLLREFGADYAEYKTSVPMIIPGLIFRWNK